ncbi:MAG: hypothetical protein O2868_19315, partial [Proteobacteria bacterium]|nr:hypothetical protein [Pseudomonadota bacterium]
QINPKEHGIKDRQSPGLNQYVTIDLGLYGPFKSTLGLRLLRLQHIEAYRLTFDISPIRPARIQWANCRVAMDVLWALIWNYFD